MGVENLATNETGFFMPYQTAILTTLSQPTFSAKVGTQIFNYYSYLDKIQG